MPQLRDDTFGESVVVLVEHSASGAMGLVVNAPTEMRFEDLGAQQDLEIAPVRTKQLLRFGGPVQRERGFILHNEAHDPDAARVADGLYLSVTVESLAHLLKHPSARLCFCLGYAGWGPGQLEKEIEEGSWLVGELTAGPVLTEDPARLWHSCIRQMGIEPGMLVTTGGLH